MKRKANPESSNGGNMNDLCRIKSLLNTALESEKQAREEFVERLKLLGFNFLVTTSLDWRADAFLPLPSKGEVYYVFFRVADNAHYISFTLQKREKHACDKRSCSSFCREEWDIKEDGAATIEQVVEALYYSLRQKFERVNSLYEKHLGLRDALPSKEDLEKGREWVNKQLGKFPHKIPIIAALLKETNEKKTTF